MNQPDFDQQSRYAYGLDLVTLLRETAAQRAAVTVHLPHKGVYRVDVNTPPAAGPGLRTEADNRYRPLSAALRQLREHAAGFHPGLPRDAHETLDVAWRLGEITELAAGQQADLRLSAQFSTVTGAEYLMSVQWSDGHQVGKQAPRLSDLLTQTLVLLQVEQVQREGRLPS